MPNTPFGSLQSKPSFDELVDYVVRLERKLNYVINGGLDSDNIFEAGGWRITPDQLASKDNDVGMSTTDTAADDVRFWAGGTDKDNAPWRVTKGGKMAATGALIESSTGYPKVVIDPDDNLIGAYAEADQYVSINPLDSGTSTPAIILRDGNIPLTALLYVDDINNEFNIGSTKNIQISALPSDLRLYGSKVRVANWSNLYSDGAAQTLQAALNAKANSFSGFTGNVYVATTSGGSPTTAKTFVNGVCTS